MNADASCVIAIIVADLHHRAQIPEKVCLHRCGHLYAFALNDRPTVGNVLPDQAVASKAIPLESLLLRQRALCMASIWILDHEVRAISLGLPTPDRDFLRLSVMRLRNVMALCTVAVEVSLGICCRTRCLLPTFNDFNS